MTYHKEPTKSYWNSFYATKKLGVEDIPSQFAAFCVNEFQDRDSFIDIGCGIGRDTFFFARYAKYVLGLDYSTSAISTCKKKKRLLKLHNIDFKLLDLSCLDDCIDFFNKHRDKLNNSVLFARFLLHAIDENVEDNFLELISRACKVGAVATIEFRTYRDEQQTKETESHYRRYLNPIEFMEKARSKNLQLSYFAEGFGFAKYKNDDAHVARLILKASSSKG